MIKTAIFDLDGTLLDTLADLTDSANYAIKQYGYPERSLMQIRSYVGNGVKMLIKRCMPQSAEEQIDAALAVFREHYKTNMDNKTRPFAGIMHALDELKARGIKLAVVSNKYDAAVKKLCDKYFDGIIDVALGDAEDVRRKPMPDSVFKALKLLDCEPQNAVYIGDSDTDVFTAHNAGLKCVGVSWGFRDRSVLEEAGADYITDDPKIMLKYILEELKEA